MKPGIQIPHRPVVRSTARLRDGSLNSSSSPPAPDLAQQVRKPADVILVRVRKHDRAHRGGAVAQVAEVREDQVDAEMLVARERKRGVENDAAALRLEHRHVLSDLAEAAQPLSAKLG